MAAYIRQLYAIDFLGQARQALSAWRQRLRDRHDLARLDNHLLRDIGLSHGHREREVNKPFWRE